MLTMLPDDSAGDPKKIVIGIAKQKAIRDRALAIARGEHKPATGKPKT